MADIEEIYFEPNPDQDQWAPRNTALAARAPSQFKASSLIPPADNFAAPIGPLGTIFYLTVTTPKKDDWSLHGPTKTFAELMPRIERSVKELGSKAAWEKWETFKTEKSAVEEHGFATYVIEDTEREKHDQYTVFHVIREANALVHDMLPAPVYTVTAHGPLLHDIYTTPGSKKVIPSGALRGRATRSRLIGSYTTSADALSAMHNAMDDLLANEVGVCRTMNMEKGGVGRCILMAMDAERVWEVKIAYDDQVLWGVRERFERDENAVGGWGRKAKWRYRG